MTRNPILARFDLLLHFWYPKQCNLHSAFLHQDKLPKFVQDCPPAMRILDLLGPIPWQQFPERDLDRFWGQTTIPHISFSVACMIKLNENLVSIGGLRRYLIEHPAFIWLLGFPLVPSTQYVCGFDPDASLPTQRHLTQLLRDISNDSLQFILEQSVVLLLTEFSTLGLSVGDCISLDTKHIIAWVKENNPKTYVSERFNKYKQPAGDADCKLGCKRKHNRKIVAQPSKTPANNSVTVNTIAVGQYYWGYGSGVIVVKVPEWGEFVLAEKTQTFDKADVSYFFPLMRQSEQRLGFRPRFGAFDAAFDAFYVYEHFFRPDDSSAFAAVPFSEKGGYKSRKFTPEGLPICTAGLPMPLLFSFTDRTTTIVEHERGKYVCPFFSKRVKNKFIKDACPVHHTRARKGGCTAIMPLSVGARLRYSLDRQSPAYKEIYNQRSATERINSQAVNLGIEHPHFRNGNAIANLNTLIYALINLRLLQQVRKRLKSDR